MNESDYRWVDDPSVAIDRKGNIVVAWVDQARKDVLCQRFDRKGERLQARSNVSKTPGTFSWLPRVAIAPDDAERIFVLWQEIVFSGGSHGGEIFFAASTDGGKRFGEPTNLSNSVAGDGKGRLDAKTWDNGSLDFTIGPRSELYAVWTEYEGALWFRRSTDRGEHFSKPLHLGGTQVAPARGPSIAASRNGSVEVAWAVGESGAADIHVARSNDGGSSFTPARAECPSSGHSDAPKLAIDDAGTVHLVYAETPPGAGERAHIRYSRRVAGAARFEPPRVLGGFGATKSSARARYPELEVDSRGTVYVLWEEYPGAGPRPRALAFTYSRDGGDHFATPVTLASISAPSLGVNGSQQGLFTRKLAVGAAQSFAIVNSTFEAGKRSDVWLLTGQLKREAQ